MNSGQVILQVRQFSRAAVPISTPILTSQALDNVVSIRSSYREVVMKVNRSLVWFTWGVSEFPFTQLVSQVLSL